MPRRRSRRAATAGVRDNDRFHVRLPMNGLSDWSRYTDGMDELSVEERVRRVISSADRKRKRLPSENRGDQIQRACPSACQILKARSDRRDVRLNKEPPAPDYPVILGTVEPAMAGTAGRAKLMRRPGIADTRSSFLWWSG